MSHFVSFLCFVQVFHQIKEREALDSNVFHLVTKILPDITFAVVTSVRDRDGVASISACFMGAAVIDGSLEAGTTDVKELVMVMNEGGHYQVMMLKDGLSVYDVRRTFSHTLGCERDVIALDCSVARTGEWLKRELFLVLCGTSYLSGLQSVCV